MNTAYMIEAYPLRNPHTTEKDIREAAFPIHAILQTLRYVVRYHKELDPDFKLPDMVNVWIDDLTKSRNAALNQKKGDMNKYIRSVDNLVFDLIGKFFNERETMYMAYTIFITLQNLIHNEKWFIPYRSEKLFYKVYEEFADYMQQHHAGLIEGAEKSATKRAAKIIEWLNSRGMY